MTTLFLPPGAPAPAFRATAVGSERVFSTRDHQGAPILLIFLDANTSRAVRDVVRGIRLEYPDPTTVMVANVIDLRIVPRLLRGTVKGMMKSALKEARREIPAGFNPDDHLILLPDWSGQISDAYRVPSVSRQVALVNIDGNGRVHGFYQGPNPQQAALDLINQVLTP